MSTLFSMAAPAQEGEIRVELSGTAMVERVDDLAISPAQIDSGMVEIGSSRTETITLSHVGEPSSAPIEIGTAELTGSHAGEYTSDFAGFETLYPGTSRDISIQFTPAFPGDKSAALSLDVHGASVPYQLLLTGRSRFPLTSNLKASTDALQFGSFNEGQSSVKTFSIENEGESEAPGIFVSAAALSGTQAGDYSTDFQPAILLPGEALDITVTLTSAVAGTKNATLTVSHDGVNPGVKLELIGQVTEPQAVPVGFGKSVLKGASIDNGTAARFGPDGKLYVSEMTGSINVFAVSRTGKNNYQATQTETINIVKNVQNHNDDGSVNNGVNGRLVTGLEVVGTAAQPIIYLASSDPRQAAGPSGTDSGLDTNSGILHKLTKNGNNWSKQDLVRGLPRSEENHVPNGLVLDGNTIYLMTGGHTNQGVPSNNFAGLPEYALSAAMLEINLGQIGGGTYDLPTLDGGNTPWGGDDGNNQAMLMNNGPVSIYASGFRNAYDLVLTEAGKFYSFDNGPNAGWGATPNNDCSNDYSDGGSTQPDNLHVVSKGYYAGHPNPTRGNKNNKWNGKSPIQGAANPEECNYKVPGKNDGALLTLPKSTNGMDEYTASNFNGGMKGDLLAAAFNENSVYRIELNGNGTKVTSQSKIFTQVGTSPLDVTSQGDGDVFPGTIWVVNHGNKNITVYEPNDY